MVTCRFNYFWESVFRPYTILACFLSLILFVNSAFAASLKPVAPGKVAAAILSNQRIKVTWRDRSNNESGFTIRRERILDTGVIKATVFKLKKNKKSFTKAVSPGRYRFRVRAFNASGASRFQNTGIIEILSRGTDGNNGGDHPTPTPIATDPSPPPTISPTPTPTINPSTILTPGSGFNGATAQPAVAGTPGAKGYDATVIGRWDVVPLQEVTRPLRVGVVAFHISGIHHVSFSLDGGPEVQATEMTHNPDTDVFEYTATFDPSLVTSDRAVEIRAIIYPNVGIARVLQDSTGRDWGEKSMRLFANAGGTLENTAVEKWVDPRQTVSISGATGTFLTKTLFRGLSSGSLGFVEPGTSGSTLVFSRYQLRQRTLNSNLINGELITTSTSSIQVSNIEERIQGNWTPGGGFLKGLIVVGMTSGAEGIVAQGGTDSTLKFIPTKGTFISGEQIADQPYQNQVHAIVQSSPVLENDGVTAQLTSVPVPNASATATGTENDPYGSLEDFFVKYTGMLDGHDATLDGITLNLKTGTYTYPSDFFTDYSDVGRLWWQAPPGTAANRWFTLQTAPGSNKADVILTSTTANLGGAVAQQKVHLKNITMKQTTNIPVLISWSSPNNNHFWVDGVDYIGLGYNDWYNRSVAGMILSDGPAFQTDISIQSAIACFGGVLGRHIYAQNLGGDFLNNQGLSIDANVRNLDIPTPSLITPPGGGVHPDVIQVLSADNLIVYGLNAFDVTAQGLNVAGGNFAIVNAVIKQKPTDVEASWIAGGSMNHILYWNVTLGTHSLQFNSGGQRNLSIRNSVMRVSTFQPTVDTSGWEVENNHFIPVWNTVGTFGTHTTVGDPGFADFANDDLRPGPGSPLLAENRPSVPARLTNIDVNGDVRGTASAIGAYKAQAE